MPALAQDTVEVSPLGFDPEGERHAVEPAAVPAEVERIVRFRALGFGQDQPFGGSLEVTALIDSNINRATRADTLGTVITDILPEFILPGNVVTIDIPAGTPGIPLPPFDGETLPGYEGGARSAVGLSLRGQAYLRRQVNNDSDFLVRVSGIGQLYEDDRFSDIIVSAQAGPEYAVGSDRIAVFAGPGWRWYGSEPYSLALGGGLSWQHPMGRYSQLRVELGAAKMNNKRDDLLDGASYSLTAEFDRTLTATSGMGAQFVLVRDTAKDPGYSTVSGALTLHAFHEFGPTTLVATVGYARLEADRQLDFFGRRRVDDRVTASLSATFTALRIGPVAPLARLNWERNRSSINYYDFRRVAGEIGLVAAF